MTKKKEITITDYTIEEVLKEGQEMELLKGQVRKIYYQGKIFFILFDDIGSPMGFFNIQ